MDALRTQFRDAMSRLGAAVNIITTAGPAGRAGFTASAVCSVTDDPAMLLVCINRSSRAYPYVIQNGVMCVNVLGGPHRPVSDSFAGFTTTTMDERFGTGSWTVLSTGAPALEGASAAVDCVIEDVVEKGTHSVLFGTVKAIALGHSESGLIWWGRDYRVVGTELA